MLSAYFEVMDRLHIKRANLYPKVSEHMQEIIEVVQKLVDKGFAYEVSGDVYYSVERFADYGKLSGRSLDDMKAGARVDVDERKNHPMDFALWKSAKPGEPAWDSPWGPGRPGWHIECSAMSLKYLGNSFDFHGGGSDLVFPHHENEIAQSEACTGERPFVRYWLHNGFITVNEEKMSKSLGNFFLVKDILEHYTPEVLRFFIITTHYRSPLDFSDERLSEAERSLERLRNAFESIKELEKMSPAKATGNEDDILKQIAQAKQDFLDAMDDDFNTALAIGVMFAAAKQINSYRDEVLHGEKSLHAEVLASLKTTYTEMADILGIVFAPANTNADENNELVSQLMELIIGIRQEARKKKDWATADQIRDSLHAVGIVLEDSPQGVRWKKR